MVGHIPHQHQQWEWPLGHLGGTILPLLTPQAASAADLSSQGLLLLVESLMVQTIQLFVPEVSLLDLLALSKDFFFL